MRGVSDVVRCGGVKTPLPGSFSSKVPLKSVETHIYNVGCAAVVVAASFNVSGLQSLEGEIVTGCCPPGSL